MNKREKKLIEEVLDIVDCVEKGYFFLKKKCKLNDYLKGVKLIHKKLKKLHDEVPFNKITPGIAKWSKMVLKEILALERAIKKTLPSRKRTLAVSKSALKVIHRLMAKVGLKPIKAKGKKFDPRLHHALRVVKHPKAGDGVVMKVYSRGYVMNKKLFKPSRVLVGQRKDVLPTKKVRPNDREHREYMNRVDFFGEMFGMENGAKVYGDYMKIADYYKERVEERYSLDKFMPS